VLQCVAVCCSVLQSNHVCMYTYVYRCSWGSKGAWIEIDLIIRLCLYVYRRSWGSRGAWIAIYLSIYVCIRMYAGILREAEGFGWKYI